LQEANVAIDNPLEWQVVSDRKPDLSDLYDALFAVKVVKHLHSNAISVVLAKQTLGLGMGQVNRVDAAKIALQKAPPATVGAILASDGMLPFNDTVLEAAKSGIIKLIVQPGGSVRDSEVIATVNEHKLMMVFTGVRHFKH
jgi:phosphoribosylaminoimidazolecarboxamide formyltransferase/IMP cyclohydrolase